MKDKWWIGRGGGGEECGGEGGGAGGRGGSGYISPIHLRAT